MRMTEGFFNIDSLNDIENGFEAFLCTNPEHSIYKAHFPGNPITPGVCIIQAAQELLEKRINRKLYLKTVKNIKFLSVIIPEKDKKIKYSFSNIVEDENGCKSQVVVSDNATVYAKISLIFNYERL